MSATRSEVTAHGAPRAAADETGPSLARALTEAGARLRAAGVPDPVGDARRLLAHAAGVAPARLTLHLGDPLGDAAAARFDAALAARSARQPVSQITGERLFWGRAFRVTPDVLDPRPETEVLVAEALARPAARVLDIGTGSGCILVSLLAEWPQARGIGTDASDAALGVARQNAERHGIGDRATFLCTDWAAGAEGSFELIVSNPPYIGADEIAQLDPEVRDWEPRAALTPGRDALAAYRALLPQAAARLARGGRIVLEIGPTQGRAVAALGAALGLGPARILRDFDGRDRIVAFSP